MVDKQTQDLGILGTMALILLAGFGGDQFLTNDQIDQTYVCDLTNELGLFDRLSESGKTGYLTINETEKRFSCRLGSIYEAWIPLREYAEQNNISVTSLLQPAPEVSTGTVMVYSVQGTFGCNVGDVVEKYDKCYDGSRFVGYVGELLLP